VGLPHGARFAAPERTLREVSVAVVGLAMRLKYSRPQRVALYLALLDLGEGGDLEQACHGMFSKGCGDLGLQESAFLELWMRGRERAMRSPDLEAAVARGAEELARRCGEPKPAPLAIEVTPRGARLPRIGFVRRVGER
jgi:hypothetical protein